VRDRVFSLGIKGLAENWGLPSAAAGKARIVAGLAGLIARSIIKTATMCMENRRDARLVPGLLALEMHKVQFSGRCPILTAKREEVMNDTRAVALQPSLLDRLIDAEPQRQDPPGAFLLAKSGLRAAVLRDLAWLLNTTRLGASELGAWPEVERSVLNYGLPAFAGQTASTFDVKGLERAIRQAILRFEPRIPADQLEVDASEDSLPGWHNLICVRIRGLIRAQPVPLELWLRAEVDLETGQVSLAELKP
jgi:type VI secretion system protein ImpF